MHPKIIGRKGIIVWVIAIAFICLAHVPARAGTANVKEIEIPADSRGPAFKALMWTPCTVAQLNRDVVASHGLDCENAGKKLSIIVISHGLAGSSVSHQDTAEALA